MLPRMTGWTATGDTEIGWPDVSVGSGQIDLVGFFKTSGYWYRTLWLSAMPESDAGRPVGFGASHSCHATTAGNLSVITEAPKVQLIIDGNLVATAAVFPQLTATFASPMPDFDQHNVTIACIGADGKPTLPPQRLIKPGSATAIVLSVDAPTTKTGTGSAVLLDGHDVAMLRATIVDADGNRVVNSSANVTFTITEGPGRVLATHNGDHKCHEPNHAAWHSAYLGLVRAIVQVTQDRVGSLASRQLLSSVDADTADVIVITSDKELVPRSIVVTASASGLRSGSVAIPVSIDAFEHSVLAAAQQSLRTQQQWKTDDVSGSLAVPRQQPRPTPPSPPATNCSFPVPASGFGYRGLSRGGAQKNASACADECCRMGPTACWTGLAITDLPTLKTKQNI